MIRVTCNNCRNHDLFGTDQYGGDVESLKKEIARFFKIPMEKISDDCSTIAYCRYCNDDTGTEYDLKHDVQKKRTVAINKKKGFGIRFMNMFKFTKRKGGKKDGTDKKAKHSSGNICPSPDRGKGGGESKGSKSV